MSYFSDPPHVLTVQTTLRVWDILFNEGGKVLFHVALAIFKVMVAFPWHKFLFAASNLNFMLSLKIMKKNESRFPMESFLVLRREREQIINLFYLQMNEEELLTAHNIGDVLSILQESTHHMYDPDELLTVRLISLDLHFFFQL